MTGAAANGGTAKGMPPENVRAVPRVVLPSGLSRNIAAAGFVGRVGPDRPKVVVGFAPARRDPAKIEASERDIRAVLGKTGLLGMLNRRLVRFDDDSMILGGGRLTPLLTGMIVAPERQANRPGIPR